MSEVTLRQVLVDLITPSDHAIATAEFLGRLSGGFPCPGRESVGVAKVSGNSRGGTAVPLQRAGVR
jgi:hypothetical protein